VDGIAAELDHQHGNKRILCFVGLGEKRCKHGVHDTLTNGCSAFRVNYPGLSHCPMTQDIFLICVSITSWGQVNFNGLSQRREEQQVCEACYHWRLRLLLCVELPTREAARAISPASVLVSHGAEKTHSVEVAIPRTVHFRMQGMCWDNSCGPHDIQPESDSTNVFKVLPILVSRVLVVVIGTSSFRQTCWGLSSRAGE
jgi:hypothetical protein